MRKGWDKDMEQEKLYVIEEKTYEAHIDEEVHLYGLLHQLAFLAGKIKDRRDMENLIDTARRYGEIADQKFCNHYPPYQKAWAAGKRVVKFIGYDAGEGYRRDKVLLGDLADRKYSKWYPLMEWGWTRDDCIRQIEAAGLPQPGKSSCFFCPSMKPNEITALRNQNPDLFRRALALEDNARKNLKTVKGLGRNYSWRERFGKEFCTCCACYRFSLTVFLSANTTILRHENGQIDNKRVIAMHNHS